MKKEYFKPETVVTKEELSLSLLQDSGGTTFTIKPTSAGDNTIRSKGEGDWDDVDDGFGW